MMRLLMVVTMAGAISLLAGLWIPVKAAVAQQLLNIAWSESQANQTPARPWPWADTWPVGRLRLPRADGAMVIMEGAHGESLAFGPAHLSATPLPGESGTVVIAGHRDTHFHTLKTIKRGDPLALQGKNGEWRHYRVSRERIVDARREKLNTASNGGNRLILITCYPFDTIVPHGPLRYVIEAKEVKDREDNPNTGAIMQPAKNNVQT